VRDEANRLVVAADKEAVKGGPAFDDDRKITPEYENQVYSYYALENTQASGDRGGYAAHYGDSEGEHPGEVGTGIMMGDTGTGEFRGHGSEQEGLSQLGSDPEDEDELRVQRTEEEPRAGTIEREAGELRVRKNVRIDRESVEVPTRYEDVSVERVPLSGEASEAQIGEDEEFYGYYTLHTEKDGEITGMLSVNGYSGEIWYHSWHGPFIAMEEEE
jgi:stress response protein YsnF